MGQPASFSFIFRLFQTNINTILQQINVKKCPPSIRPRDSNPRPLERESPPITTGPGLPPISSFWYLAKFTFNVGFEIDFEKTEQPHLTTSVSLNSLSLSELLQPQ